MYYILYDESSIINTENLDIVTEYLTSGMKLYGYSYDEKQKDLLIYECYKMNG